MGCFITGVAVYLLIVAFVLVFTHGAAQLRGPNNPVSE